MTTPDPKTPKTSSVGSTLPPPPTPILSSPSAFKPTAPKMGGLEQISSDVYSAWTGGKPNLTWTTLSADATPSPTTPSQYRGTGHNDVKGYSLRIMGLKKKFNSDLSTPLNVFTTAVFAHLQQHGLDTISYLPDPADPTKMESVVTHHTRFKLKDVRLASAKLSSKFDKYDKSNDRAAISFLRASLHQDLLHSVDGIIKDSDTFAVLWCIIMEEIHRNSHNFFLAQEAAIKSCDPLTAECCNPGQQMDKWVEHIRKFVILLSKSGKYDHKLSETIIILAMRAGGDHNEDWKSVLRPIKLALRAKYANLGLHTTFQQMDKDFEKDDLSPDSILNKIKDHYRSVFDSNDWPPVSDLVDKSAAPLAKFKSSAYFGTPNQADSATKPTFKPKPSFGSYKFGATKPSSPKKVSFNPSTKPPARSPSSPNWKTTPPKKDAPQTMEVKGRKWFWCQKCNRGKGRWSTTHGTAQHTGKPSKPTTTHQANVSTASHDDASLGVWCTVATTPSTDPSASLDDIPKGVYCTAIDPHDNPSPSTILGILFGIAICVYTFYDVYRRSFLCHGYYHPSSIFPLSLFPLTKANSFHAFYVRSFNLRRLCGLIFGPTADFLDIILSCLRHSIISWILSYMIYGVTPIDMLVELLLSGGNSSDVVNAQFLAGGRLHIVYSYFTILSTCFKSYITSLLALCIPTLREVFTNNNIKFLAPLSWMIVAYVSIYMTRRSTANVSFSSKRHSYQSCHAPSTKNNRYRTSKSRNRHQRKFYRSKPPKPSAPPSDHMMYEIFCNSKSKPSSASLNPPVSFKPYKRNKFKGRVQASVWNATCSVTPPTFLSRVKETLSTLLWFISFIYVLPYSIWYNMIRKSSTTSTQAQSNIDQHVKFSRNANHLDNQHCPDCSPTVEPSLFYSFVTLPTMKTFRLGSDLLHRVLFTSPSSSYRNMINASRFSLIWDTGASISISPNKRDFIKLSNPDNRITLLGISKGLKVQGQGIVRWNLIDESGAIRPLEVPALYVPNCKVRLLRPHAIIEQHPDETIDVTDNGMRLSGFDDDPSRGSVLAIISDENNLPVCAAFNNDGLEHASTALNATISVVHSSNLNLSPAEKFFLQWHWRLGHPGFNRLMFLFRSGILSTTESSKRMVRSVLSSIKHVPKCAACMFGRQKRLPSPGKTAKIIDDQRGVLKQNNLNPGDEVSLDHFYCSTQGRLFSSRGKTKQEHMFCGGLLAIDHASNYIFVKCMKKFSAQETLQAKEEFELNCRNMGVIVQGYLTDKGPAFASKDFITHVDSLLQKIRFAGVGAHHQNGHAESAIGIVMSMARTMMLHAAVHWPDMADPSLWPMAVHHAVYLYNHLPDPSTGLSPHDLFSRTRWPLKHLHDMHVWGCPVYSLDKSIADGKKIPRWQTRSNRCVFMGFSPDHTTNVPLLLDSSTGTITPKFHVVFDDWFSTVTASADNLPDFNSEEWMQMFGDSTAYYHADEEDVVPEPSPPSHLQTQRLNRAWRSDDKYMSQPALPSSQSSTVPSRHSTSLDPSVPVSSTVPSAPSSLGQPTSTRVDVG